MSIANRPLSPHLQVYKPQLTSMLSITFRVTGLALSVGAVFVVVQLLAALWGPDEFEAVQGFARSWLGVLLLIAWSFALFFHLAAGIRHLVWDAGYGYDLESTYRSGVIVIGAAAALTLIAWIAGLVVWGEG